MNTVSQNNPASAPAPTTSLAGIQGVIGTASGFVPSSLDMVFSFLTGALAMLGVVFGAQQVLKRRRTTRPCRRCRGTGVEPAEQKLGQTCDECNGTGQVEDEDEPDIECPHCKGEGEDPCHVCKGTGRDAAGQECPACQGGGKTLTGKLDKNGEPEVADCEICHGEGEISPTIKKMVPCKNCGGTGRI